MALYFRKSFGKGLFRVNLSRSGLSYSIGVRGARVRFSQKGTYVTLSSNGISYRKKISGFSENAHPQNNEVYHQHAPEAHSITSGNLEEITDVDSQDFIQELKEKAQKISFYKWYGVYPISVIGILLLYIFSEDYTGLFWFLFSMLGICSVILLPRLKQLDEERLLVQIYYDMDERIREVYNQFANHFSKLMNSSKTWQYLHSERTNDYKYSSGAAFTITRKPLLRVSTNKTPSKIFKTNVEIPYIGLINTELYFFPERIIVKRGQQFGAIMYKNVDCYGTITRFIESDAVPGDATVVGHTWRYLNKNGTPDRRFNNNYQLPICHYSEYSFQSASGLNEKISTSKVGALDDFIRLIKGIGKLQQHMNVRNTQLSW